MTLARRIIPCLDTDGARVVKGVRFVNLRDAGDPAELAARYNREGADELVVLDIAASRDRRSTFLETIRRVAEQLTIPLAAGGGVCSLEDGRAILRAGADKLTINTAAVFPSWGYAWACRPSSTLARKTKANPDSEFSPGVCSRSPIRPSCPTWVGTSCAGCDRAFYYGMSQRTLIFISRTPMQRSMPTRLRWRSVTTASPLSPHWSGEAYSQCNFTPRSRAPRGQRSSETSWSSPVSNL